MKLFSLALSVLAFTACQSLPKFFDMESDDQPNAIRVELSDKAVSASPSVHLEIAIQENVAK